MAFNKSRSVAEVCQKLYNKGWAIAPGTGIAIRDGDQVLAPPAEVLLDSLEPEDIFTLSLNLDSKGNPELYPGADNPASDISQHSTLFVRMFQEFECNCIIYCQPHPALLVASFPKAEFKMTNQQAITLIPNGETGKMLPSNHVLRVPIIPNCDDQNQLFKRLEKAFSTHPETNAVLIRGNGLMVCGDNVSQTVLMAEALVSLFSLSVEMKKLGLEVQVPKPIINIKKQESEEVKVIKPTPELHSPFFGMGKNLEQNSVKPKSDSSTLVPPKSTWSGKPKA